MNRSEAMGPGDSDLEIRFAHLAGSFRRHIDEEEALFSALDRSRVDFVQLGVEMGARRVRLAVANGIGILLNQLVRRRKRLRVHILDWDFPMIFGHDREFPPLYGLNWRPHRRVRLATTTTVPSPVRMTRRSS